MKNKLLTTCVNKCWCRICGKGIKKGELYFYKYLNAAKFGVRLNICKDCIAEMFREIEYND